MFEVAGAVGGRARGHRRRQVGEQSRVECEAAHHLQRGGGVLLPDGDPAVQRGLDDAAAGHVGEVQRTALAGTRCVRQHRADRCVPLLFRLHPDQFALGVAQRGEPAAEDAAGVQADGVVEEARHRHGRVPVDHQRLAPVLLGPRVAHRQAVLVGLPGGVAVEGVRSDPAGGAAVVLLRQAGVADHQLAVVQQVVADQVAHEGADLLAELLRLPGQLVQRLLEAVRDGDAPPAHRPAELVLVVSGHAEGVAGRDHAHHQAQHTRGVRASVDQVADEDGRPAAGVGGVDRAARRVMRDGVAEAAEQGLQLGAAAVDVADDVERAGEVAQVVVALLGDDLGGRDLGLAAQDVHLAEALALQASQRAAQLAVLPRDHVRGQLAVRAGSVPLRADARRHVQDDRDRQHVVVPGDLDELLAGLGLDVGGVHDGQPAGREPLADDVVQQFEGLGGGRLVVLVVGDQAPAEVRGDHLGGQEVLAGEAGLTGAAGTDEDDEGDVGDGQDAAGGRRLRGCRIGAECVVGHRGSPPSGVVVAGVTAAASVTAAGVTAVASVVPRRKRASWVGVPTSGSSGPTDRNETV